MMNNSPDDFTRTVLDLFLLGISIFNGVRGRNNISETNYCDDSKIQVRYVEDDFRGCSSILSELNDDWILQDP